MNHPSHIEEILSREGVFICSSRGVSMYPMLRNGCDTVIIRRKDAPLKKYDVALYRSGERYVLHRVIKVLPAGGYHIRGDNCMYTEENIPEDSVIGVLDSFTRGERDVSLVSVPYKIYSRLCVALHPLVFTKLWLLSLIRKKSRNG